MGYTTLVSIGPRMLYNSLLAGGTVLGTSSSSMHHDFVCMRTSKELKHRRSFVIFTCA